MTGLWAIAALGSSVIWRLSHYPLSAGMLEETVHMRTGFRIDGGLEREAYLFGLAMIAMGKRRHEH